MNNREWFKQAQYGMMVHWGLYSVLGGEWKGKRGGKYSEWIQNALRIPIKEYEQVAKVFNPIYFNADEWVKLAKDSGMQYIVVTAKHHDGFALYHSKVDKFNICDATPFKRDVIAELAESCAKHNIKLGLYYSQALDWHCEHGAGYTNDFQGIVGTSWCNDWDFPNKDKKDFSICFEEKIKPQVTELLTNYGDLCLMWFDCPITITNEQSEELTALVRRYQPGCLTSSRLYHDDNIANGDYDYFSLGDNQYPESIEELKSMRSPYGLYETSGTMNESYGYSRVDHDWITPEEIREHRKKLNDFGINYLLNVGPDGLGRIPTVAQDILLKAAEK